MPFCPKCGKEALETDRFCLNCGHPFDRAPPTPAPVQAAYPSTEGLPPSGPPASQKSSIVAALLNFFLPGIGYAYIGAGRDGKLIVFGLLMFVSLTLTFYVSIVNLALSPPTTTTTTSSPLAFVGLLEFIFPFAVAYDGYHRAKR